MPKFSDFSGITIRGVHSHGVGILRAALPTVALALVSFFSPIGANGQIFSAPSSAQSSPTQASGDERSRTATDAGDSEDTDDDRPTSTNSMTTMTALSSDQIISILQQSPDLVVELKSQVSDRMQTQGMQVDANDISDQMLYNQIATDANLRMNITTFLRMHGDVPDDGLQPLGSSVASGGTENGLSSAQNSGLLSGSPGGSSLARGTGLDSGTSPSDESDLPTASNHSMSGAGSRQDSGETRNHEQVHASTDIPKVDRQPAPYNLRSMRDLYTQIPERNMPLKRFGSEVFVNRNVSAARGVSSRDTPLDVSLGPDYVVGPGDTLKIDIWGSVTVSIARVIERDGHILLPEAGSLDVAGLPLEQAQNLIKGAIKQQYRNAEVAVTVSRLRSVRVYVVGDVQHPGGYDISSLATPMSALYAAGGPTSIGSLRTLRHYRAKQLIEDVDLYDFLLHGMRGASARFESGDTLLVPPAGPQVAVFGSVRRPAIYELKAGESTVASVIDDAGGFTAAASFSHITIERIDANRLRETVTLNIPDEQSPEADRNAIASFQVKDGDRIHVEPILPYSQRAVYLEGHVVRPGRLPYTDRMRLSDILRSYRDMLPEPAAHGEIIRLVSPDLHAETIDFDVPDVLIGNANVDLHPFDTIRIFGRYEVDAPKVTIRGEVLRPGTYPMSKGMTAAQLVRMAGGFKRDALLDSADLTSYSVVNGEKVVGSLSEVRIGAAVSQDLRADVSIKPGNIADVLSSRAIS